jgi:hypothetical protein
MRTWRRREEAVERSGLSRGNEPSYLVGNEAAIGRNAGLTTS